ncbi:MAG: histidine phosphatase family protein [Roseibium sp.]|uniref:histidine phosphatase family protein n=1 Tax=Roseibium sp. TaxID=1936156 RepID=UPI002601FB0B|nr:histidine phosphatase family protein [Roseibium sp.]MCV0429738.1 histidine phosphatase family protein [Roseibium sp.]
MNNRFAILLRHGDYRQKAETPSALQPFGLTEKGERQAREAGIGLTQLIDENSWKLDREIFSSRQLRAWQTADLLSKILTERSGRSFQVTENEALAERSVGAFANLTISEIEQILDSDPRYAPPPGNWKSDSRYRLPVQGAESLMEAGLRVAGFLKERMEALDGTSSDTRVFVGHGASIRHAAHHLGVLEFERIAQHSMFHAKPVVLKLSPTGKWTHHTGAWKERKAPATTLD